MIELKADLNPKEFPIIVVGYLLND